VLSCVLLHVLEASIPVNHAVNGTRRNVAIQHVQNRAIFAIEDVDDRRGTQMPDVERLPAGSWIERRAVGLRAARRR
jgi:hypothetical protein